MGGWVGAVCILLVYECPLVVLACESLHVCTVCIWRSEHAKFCMKWVFVCLFGLGFFVFVLVLCFFQNVCTSHINFHSFSIFIYHRLAVVLGH